MSEQFTFKQQLEETIRLRRKSLQELRKLAPSIYQRPTNLYSIMDLLVIPMELKMSFKFSVQQQTTQLKDQLTKTRQVPATWRTMELEEVEIGLYQLYLSFFQIPCFPCSLSQLSKTISGRSCQPWSENKPHTIDASYSDAAFISARGLQSIYVQLNLVPHQVNK